MTLAPLDLSGLRLKQTELVAPQPVDLRPPLLIVAFLLALGRRLATLLIGGRWRRQAGPAIAALLLFCVAAPPQPRAQNGRNAAQEMLSQTRHGGRAANKARLCRSPATRAPTSISREGLASLSEVLARRTALVPGEPQGVDPAHDELAFYPLIYWPIAPDRPQPGPEAAKRLAAYMKQGGLVLFDTRDAQMQFAGRRPHPGAELAAAFLADIDLPPLEPCPSGHVLTRTFYILENFVGRTENGPTYIEALPPETEPGNPAGAGWRRRLSDHHRLQRSGRRLGRR